ncbi:MAG: hypothetical protein ACOH2M_03830, partial [Cypionkella sp.]
MLKIGEIGEFLLKIQKLARIMAEGRSAMCAVSRTAAARGLAQFRTVTPKPRDSVSAGQPIGSAARVAAISAAVPSSGASGAKQLGPQPMTG